MDELKDNMSYDANPQREDLKFIKKDLQLKYPKDGELNTNSTQTGIIGEINASLNAPSGKIDLQETNVVDNSLLYKDLNSGKRVAMYDSYLDGYGEEDRQAKMQSSGNKWLNGTIKNLGGKVFTGVVGGTIGTAYGVLEAIAKGSTDSLYDNSFTDYLDDLNTKLDYKLPNYYTDAEKEKGFLGSAGTANFWANDLFGGLSFTVSTVISEGIWAAATGGGSLATSAARIGASGFRNLKKIKNIKELSGAIKKTAEVNKRFARAAFASKYADKSVRYGKAAELANTARFTYTSAGFEAGLEARMFRKEQEEAFNEYYLTNFGRVPNADERATFTKNLDSSVNTVFATNLALVGSSNLAIFGKAFGIKSPFTLPKVAFNKKIFGKGVDVIKKTTETGQEIFDTAKAIKRTKLQKGLGLTKSIFKAPFTEGIYEEGGQAVVSASGENYINSTYNINEEVLGSMESFYEALSETYGTKEGWKEIGLGMLIGAIGGAGSNALSGQGVFDAPTEALKDFDTYSENKASVMNRYMSEKAMDNLITANNIANAQKFSEEEAKKGNTSRATLYDNMAVMAQVMQGEKYDLQEEMYENMKAYIDSKPTEFFTEQGIEESEIEDYKKKSLTEYKNRQKSYAKAKEFADYIIADQGLIEVEDGKGGTLKLKSEKIKSIIAYQMVMAEVSEGISNSVLDNIKQTITEIAPNISGRLNTLLSLQDSLAKKSKTERKKFYKYQKELRKLMSEISALEKKREKVKATPTTEKNRDSVANELNSLNNKINVLQKRIPKTEQKITDFVENIIGIKANRANLSETEALNEEALELSDVLTENADFVTVDDLLNTESKFEQLQELYEALDKSNPIEATKLRILIDEYKDALGTFKRFNETASELANPETGLKKIKAWYSGKEDINEHTLKVLKSIQKSAQEQNEIDNLVFPKENSNENEADDTKPPIADDPKTKTQQNEDTEEQSETPTQKSKKTPIEKLREKLKSILSVNSYTAENFGENIEDSKPTEEQFVRYEALYEKFKGKDISKVKGSAPKSTLTRYNLTKEEAQELEELHRKLIDWRVISETSNEGVTIANIIAQINAYKEANNKTQEQAPNITEEEQTEALATNIRSTESKEKNDSNILQNYDTIVLTQKGKEVHISHLNPAVLDENNIPYKTDKAERVIIKKEQLNEVLELLGMKIIDFPQIKSSRWSYAFKKKGDKWVPADSDFKITAKNSDTNRMSSESIYEMEPGEEVFFSVDTNDSYNDENFRERALRYKSMTGKEKKEFKKELISQLSIYITNKDGQIISQLKRLTGTNANPSFNKLRKVAADKYIEYYKSTDQDTLITRQVSNLLEEVLDSIGVSTIQLPFSTTVSRVMIGIPNIEVKENEDGTVTPISKQIPESTYGRVIAYGYSDNGELVLNPNSEVTGEVNRRYVRVKDKKVPVIVVKEGNQLIAFPVTLAPTETNAVTEISDILSDRTIKREDKLPLLIVKVKEVGLNPEDYNMIDIGSESFFGSNGAKRLRKDLLDLKLPMSYSQIESKGTTKEDFLSIASTTLNMEDRLFRSPKLEVDIKKGLKETKEDNRMSIEEIESFERNGFVGEDRMLDIINKKASGQELSRPELGVYSLYSKIIDGQIKNKQSLSKTNEEKSDEEINKDC